MAHGVEWVKPHGPEWVHPQVYREARKAGYTPAQAAYLGRDPVVRLDSDPNITAYDAGSFDYKGETFGYRIVWDDDCLCDPEYDEDIAELEHRTVFVSLGYREEVLGSVCGDRRAWLARLSDDRHVAEVARSLADELLDTRT